MGQPSLICPKRSQRPCVHHAVFCHWCSIIGTCYFRGLSHIERSVTSLWSFFDHGLQLNQSISFGTLDALLKTMTQTTKMGLVYKLTNVLETFEACGSEAELREVVSELISLRILIRRLETSVDHENLG